MVNLPVNLRPPSSLDPAQAEALADVQAPAAVDADAASALSEEELMSLDVWGDGAKMLLNGDAKPVVNFDSQERATSIFALGGSNA
jgi:hypothetical protein